MLLLRPEEVFAEVGRIYINPVIEFLWDSPRDGEILIQTGYLDPRHMRTLGITDITKIRNSISTIAAGTERGKPSFGWALSYVEAGSWTAVDGLAATPNLNIVRMDGVVDDSIPANLRARIAQVGASTQQELNSVTTYRETILLLLHKQNPTATLETEYPEIFF